MRRLGGRVRVRLNRETNRLRLPECVYQMNTKCHFVGGCRGCFIYAWHVKDKMLPQVNPEEVALKGKCQTCTDVLNCKGCPTSARIEELTGQYWAMGRMW